MVEQADTTLGSPEATLLPEADFLFHLYRGSELLHDNRLIEAQSELEYAEKLEPGDARTRGLLAVVYFRSGFYARAIGVYRELLADAPSDPTLRLNLSLCYLKAGEPEPARQLLEALVMEDVADLRAWGYLAVALERLGYIEQAGEAFDRAGQPELARRVDRRSQRPRAHRDRATEARQEANFEALDQGELRVDLARADPHLVAHEASAPALHPHAPAPSPLGARPKLDTLGWGTRRELSQRAVWASPPPLANLIEDARVERLGDSLGVHILGAHLAKIDLEGGALPGFAFRLDALRSYHGTLDRDIVARRSRAGAPLALEAGGETFGGIGSPFASMQGPGQVLLGPRSGQRLHAFTLDRDVVFFLETSVLGFALTLAYENGKLGGGDALSLVQFKGSGALLIELPGELLSLDVKAGGITVKKDVVIGWVGRLLPHPLVGAEAPCGQRGLIVFSGEGNVLVSAK
jgi:tetratricopeptide (TPR) repeat protein